MREAGVSLRLRAVQVVEHKEMVQENPFGNVSGIKPMDDFGLPPAAAAVSSSMGITSFDDDIPFAPEWRA
jgi:hypothetical protein